MNFQPRSTTRRLGRPHPKLRSGFALIVTVCMLALLPILAIGLLSLASISIRSSGQQEAMAHARANARLALMLAIGELQQNAGPDQRITAPASILDSTPQTEEITGVGEPSVTGVWKANQQSPGQAPVIPDYDKSSSFQSWLVSGLTAEQSSRPDALYDSLFRNDTGVPLVGKSTTADANPNSFAHLWAGKIPVHAPGQTSKPQGNAA